MGRVATAGDRLFKDCPGKTWTITLGSWCHTAGHKIKKNEEGELVVKMEFILLKHTSTPKNEMHFQNGYWYTILHSNRECSQCVLE